MKSRKVSILIPAYNRQRYIAECIQSALDQTFTNIEIVVVDNASTDSTWDICQEYAARDSRIRVFRNYNNIGPVRNWLRCAQEAKGEYSKILFSDDILEPDCIERMVESLNNEEIGFVFCAAKIGESKEQSKIAYSNVKDQTIDSSQYINLIMKSKAPVSPGAVLLRTTDLLKNLHTDFPTSMRRSYDSNGAGPDVMIMLLTADQYPKIRWISIPFVFFRAHQESFSIENKDSKITDGYTSAISWYLINNKKKLNWLKYLAYVWVTSIRNRKPLNPMRLLNDNEGEGRMVDLFCLLAIIPVVALNKAFSKLI